MGRLDGRRRRLPPDAHPLRCALGHPAERAYLGGRRLLAVQAGPQRRVARRTHQRAPPLEKPPVEALLGAGDRLLEEVERLLVEEAFGPQAVGALLHDVVDAADDRVCRRLALRDPVERLHFLHEVRVGARENGRLPGQELGLPVQEVAEQDRRLIIQIVPGGDHGEPLIQRDLVEEVALAQAARRATGPPRGAGKLLHVHPVFLRDVRDEQLGALSGGVRFRLALGLLRVLPDAEVDVQSRRPIPEPSQDVPERQTVLPP